MNEIDNVIPGHAGSITYTDQCQSIKIRIQELIPVWINKDHCWSIQINKDQFYSIKIKKIQSKSMLIIDGSGAV